MGRLQRALLCVGGRNRTLQSCYGTLLCPDIPSSPSTNTGSGFISSARVPEIYQDQVCNRVALLGAVVVWLTAYVGVIFSSSGSNLLLQALVPCFHTWFLLSWIMANCVTGHHPFLWLLRLNGPRKAIKLPSN